MNFIITFLSCGRLFLVHVSVLSHLFEGMEPRKSSRLLFYRQRKEKMIKGLTSPYAYVGAYGATFPLHTEDENLYSINYLHMGAPKVWFVSRINFLKVVASA